ncbi:MAG TPA: exodeoxyribonuclease III [Gammaproteobacteria bacterium]|nr:exodeoxyribonuclease III [Gammaproteobacteria bacterium]
MFRIITLNLNGIRSAAKKGFFAWLKDQNADVVCVQEVKAHEADLADEIFKPEGYHSYFHFAEKKGYSGVGLYTRHAPLNVLTGLGWPEADQEGRYVEADLGKVTVISLYMPSGTSGELRQAIKMDFLKRFAKHLVELQQEYNNLIICGDWNIAHRRIDLKNWRSNRKNSGFLPEERAWMDELFGSLGFVDAFREVNKQEEQYTWWSTRGRAWAKNVGWRIDYQVVTPGLKDKIQSVSIYKDQRFSDHAPLIIDYSI